MPTTPAPSTRRRRLLATLVVAASAVVVPLTTGAPAGAATAPLITTEGIGIRVDENAVLGPVLEDIENSLYPKLKQMVIAGASVHTGVPSPSWIDATVDLELGIDFINAGTTGYFDGGVRLEADISDLEIFTYASSPPSCIVTTSVSDLTVFASSRVNSIALPSAPFTAMPSTGSWPWATVSSSASGPPICSSLLTPPFDWTGFTDVWDPTSTAAQVQAELETQLADLLDHLWFDNVESVVGSLPLAGYGVTYNQIRTDTNGLVATADVLANAGITIDGFSGFPVTGAQDSGVTSNVSTLLAQRSLGTVATDIIVSLHPNVTNQYLSALHDYWGGWYSWTDATSALGTALINPAFATCYSPTDWGTYLEASAAPYITPTGTGGRPQMRFPQSTLQFHNLGSCTSGDPVSTFTGTVYGVEVTPAGVPLSPRGSASTATWTATRTQADAAALARTPPATAATLLSWTRGAIDTFLASMPSHIDMRPGGFPWRTAALCTTCGRFTGDQRITQGWNIS